MSQEKSDINIGVIFTMLFASVAFLVVVIIGTQAWLMYEERDEIDRKWPERNADLVFLNQNQKAQINLPIMLVDPAAKTYVMPIDEAMKIVVREKGTIVFPAAK